MRLKTVPLKADDPIPLAHNLERAAARLGIGKSVLSRLITAGKIRAFKLGTRTLVPEAELIRYIDANTPK